MAEPVSTWIAATLSIIGGVWVLVRRLLASVTREELAAILKDLKEDNQRVLTSLEVRHEKKTDELLRTLLSLHEDNKEARHRLRDGLTAPVTDLSTEIVRLRQALDRKQL